MRRRITIAMVLIVFFCIGGLSTYLIRTFEHSYLDNLTEQLTNQALLVANTSKPYFSGADTNRMNELAQESAGAIGARITIIDRAGTVLGDSEENPVDMENHANRPEIREALAGKAGSSIRFSSTLGFDMLYVAVPVSSDGQYSGVVRVSLPLSEIKQEVTRIQWTVVLAALIALAIAFLIAFWLSHSITDPIKKLTRMSWEIARGKFDRTIKVTSGDEVGELGRAFNKMTVRLKEMVTLLTTERDRMEVILSNMGDGIVVVDSGREITLLNGTAEKLLGISQDSAKGHKVMETVRNHEIDEILLRCLSQRVTIRDMVQIRNGGRYLGLIATPLPDENACVLLLQDLTELHRLQNVRRDFISNITHELRTPLASIKMMAETLSSGAASDPSVAQDFLDRINLEVDKLAQMVQELSELSRIEKGEAVLDKQKIKIDELIAQSATRLREQANRAGITIELSLKENLPEVMADINRLEQVLVNLIHNAIKFTPSSGKITVSTNRHEEGILIIVEDTGSGIAPEDIARIFERFYKADKARSGKGSGLGLAIVKHIVEAHGGRIWVESVERQGSTFYFTLPLSANV